jgi:hypothetical protein
LIKVILALHHRQIPPHLNFSQPNPFIPWQDFPIEVPVRLVDWDVEGPRRAGVSSFGLSGINAHVVLEEAPVVFEEEGAIDGQCICSPFLPGIHRRWPLCATGIWRFCKINLLQSGEYLPYQPLWAGTPSVSAGCGGVWTEEATAQLEACLVKPAATGIQGERDARNCASGGVFVYRTYVSMVKTLSPSLLFIWNKCTSH